MTLKKGKEGGTGGLGEKKEMGEVRKLYCMRKPYIYI